MKSETIMEVFSHYPIISVIGQTKKMTTIFVEITKIFCKFIEMVLIRN